MLTWDRAEERALTTPVASLWVHLPGYQQIDISQRRSAYRGDVERLPVVTDVSSIIAIIAIVAVVAVVSGPKGEAHRLVSVRTVVDSARSNKGKGLD